MQKKLNLQYRLIIHLYFLPKLMRESIFLKQNADKWKQMEANARNPQGSADELAQHFMEVTDDLAYAKTFFPKSNVIGYLNGLASLYHQKIYRNKKENKKRIVWLWLYELPYLFKVYQKTFLYAFLFFLVFLLIGIFSARHDPDFVRLILGDNYVNMTLENIRNGDPFGVYKQADPVKMFLGIAFNNIRVTLFVFASGIFFSVGSLVIAFKNIVMLGAFETFFFQQGLGLKSILVVFIHGTLEIWGIIIAVASGMILGNSILFPGTYSRKDAMLRGARDGLKIVFGLIPLFIAAGFLEGFVTRHTHMPIALSISVLAASLAFIVWYFIVYPNIIYKKINAAENGNSIDIHPNLKRWLSQKQS
ncbi:stage II sporulation protein M [Haoranjiania flava]|uniref:Stage II sporulation protein M n=1 Tax=Haoranjiania flava TaxID=1856322 RepID=A0AAE3LJN2_9BACT|nr:stage II sporulation protein M [Haoranjiania flava]MCU7693554.1 stage II sporulation protein M [Haoranjiania flava]